MDEDGVVVLDGGGLDAQATTSVTPAKIAVTTRRCSESALTRIGSPFCRRGPACWCAVDVAGYPAYAKRPMTASVSPVWSLRQRHGARRRRPFSSIHPQMTSVRPAAERIRGLPPHPHSPARRVSPAPDRQPSLLPPNQWAREAHFGADGRRPRGDCKRMTKHLARRGLFGSLRSSGAGAGFVRPPRP